MSTNMGAAMAFFVAAMAFLNLCHGATNTPGCNSKYKPGISCCEDSFTLGDNANGEKEKFIQAHEFRGSCIDSCKRLHPTSTGVTESVEQKYSSGEGINKNKCWCEFGDAKLDPSNQRYQTCVFNKRIVNPVVLLTGGYAHEYDTHLGIYDLSSEESVEVFSPFHSGSCNKDLEDLPDDRNSHTATFLNGEVILSGGNSYECLSLNESQQFVPHSTLEKRHSSHTAAVVSDGLLLVGGQNSWPSKRCIFSEFWNGSEWVLKEEDLDDLEDMCKGSCGAAINHGTMLIAGGRGLNTETKKRPATNKMVKYKDGAWEMMENYPGPGRAWHSCAFVQTPEGDGFLIAGGRDEHQKVLDTSYLYNIERKEWEEVGKLATGRADGQMVVVDGRVIFLGGEHLHEELSVEEFDVESKTWVKIQQNIKRKRYNFGAAVVPGALVGC